MTTAICEKLKYSMNQGHEPGGGGAARVRSVSTLRVGSATPGLVVYEAEAEKKRIECNKDPDICLEIS